MDNEEFEVNSDIEIDELLADLPFNLIKENVIDQINNPLTTQIDYVTIIIEKCDVLKKQFEENEEVIHDINEQLSSFFKFVIQQLDDKFGLDVDLNDYNDLEIIEIGESLYTFLILRYKRNVCRFLYKFIVKNSTSMIKKSPTFMKLSSCIQPFDCIYTMIFLLFGLNFIIYTLVVNKLTNSEKGDKRYE
jgi:hypothetical protein